MTRPHTARTRPPSTHWIGGWVSPRANRDVLAQWKKQYNKQRGGEWGSAVMENGAGSVRVADTEEKKRETERNVR
jgi:hypothetical protein